VYRILSKESLGAATKLFVIEASEVARKARPGQFVIVRISKEGERIPLTIADFDREAGTITIVFQEIGKTTKQMGSMKTGDELSSFTGPLGKPTEIENYGTVLCIGGGVGIAPIYPIARALRGAGNHVISIIGARTKDLLFWEEKLRSVSDELVVCTDDGSYGRKALVTEPIKERLEDGQEISRIWAIGPAIMMKFCSLTSKPFGTPTIVSVEVEGQTRFACVDGPEFDGHKVDWGLLLERQRIYLEEEKLALESYEHHCRCGKIES